MVDLEPVRDERGFFARAFCVEEFAELGLETNFPQHSVAYSQRRGTLRGLHYQREPMAEAKFVRCIRGEIFDAIADLRPASPTFGRTFCVTLDDRSLQALFVPRGFAHAYQTLLDDTLVFYQMSARYAPDLAAGIRWDDPTLRISWPVDQPIVSERDRELPTFADVFAP